MIPDLSRRSLLKTSSSLALAGAMTSLLPAGASAAEPEPPKIDLSKIRNPVIPGWYADPELHYFNGKFYLYPTTSKPFDEQTYFEGFISDDLVNWKPRGKLLDFKDVPWSGNRCAWAPAICPRYGTWFMYFSAGDGKGIGLGIWHAYERRFIEPYGKPLIAEWPFGAQPIDANCFVDDDGQPYLYFGGHRRCVMVKLKKDMCRLDGDYELVTPEGYVEGPYMFKRKGKYYFMWSEGNWTDDTYGVAYSITDSPRGPFKRVAKILQSDPKVAKGPGHNSVMRLPGTEDEWVMCYHRRPLNETDGNHRVVCIDKLSFREDGTIEPVKMT